MKVFRSMAIAAAVAVVASMAVAQTKAPVKTGKIYVGTMGVGSDADELRVALGYELAQTGFKVVDFEPQADSVLTGLIVTRVDEGKTAKRVTTFLKDRRSGKLIWNEDFGSTYRASSSDPIRKRAEEIAKALKEDSTVKAKAHNKKK